jgi:Protein of unknown function (DUF3500)
MPRLFETPTRRAALVLGAAAAVQPLLPTRALSAPLDLGDAAPIRQRAAAFLAVLDESPAERARFPFGGDAWKRWNYFGVGGFKKPGLRLEEMTATQKDAAWALTAAILSQEGVDKARRVMLNQEILREQGNGVNERSGERFSYAIFGEPSASGEWALRIEGHHLSLSYTIRNDRLTGVTPSSFSSSPNRVATGRHAGLVTLRREDALARRLAGDLTGAVRARAFQQASPYNNILASAGRERSLTKREGIPVGDLNQSQRDLAEEILSAFMIEHLKGAYAEPVARILRNGRDATHFTALGSPRPEEALYYRFHGDRFVVEFASVDSAALHLHTIFHLA